MTRSLALPCLLALLCVPTLARAAELDRSAVDQVWSMGPATSTPAEQR